jgi:hypothetical protein
MTMLMVAADVGAQSEFGHLAFVFQQVQGGAPPAGAENLFAARQGGEQAPNP